MDAEIGSLSTVPPTEFVAARDALAKTLRAAKRKDEADAVRSLRRPSPTDWALNTVAVRDPDLLRNVGEQFGRLRTAQTNALDKTGDADELRNAMTAARDAAAQLRKAAKAVLAGAGRSKADAGPLASRVNEAMVNPELFDVLRSGQLGMMDADAVNPFDATPDPFWSPPTSKPTRTTRTKPSDTKITPTEPIDELAERRARAEAERRAEQRRQGQAAADEALKAAENEADGANAEVIAATVALEEAQAALTEAKARRIVATAQQKQTGEALELATRQRAELDAPDDGTA